MNGGHLTVASLAGAAAGALAGRMWAWQCTDLVMKVCRAGYFSWAWFFAIGVPVGVGVGVVVYRKLGE